MIEFKFQQGGVRLEAEPPLLSVEELAASTGLHKRTIYRAIEDGDLPAYRLRGQLRIAVDHRDQWLTANLVAARPTPTPNRPADAATTPARRASGRLQPLMAHR